MQRSQPLHSSNIVNVKKWKSFRNDNQRKKREWFREKKKRKQDLPIEGSFWPKGQSFVHRFSLPLPIRRDHIIYQCVWHIRLSSHQHKNLDDHILCYFSLLKDVTFIHFLNYLLIYVFNNVYAHKALRKSHGYLSCRIIISLPYAFWGRTMQNNKTNKKGLSET